MKKNGKKPIMVQNKLYMINDSDLQLLENLMLEIKAGKTATIKKNEVLYYIEKHYNCLGYIENYSYY